MAEHQRRPGETKEEERKRLMGGSGHKHGSHPGGKGKPFAGHKAAPFKKGGGREPRGKF